MKLICKYLFCISLVLLTYSTIHAQDKQDMITMRNGDKKTGKVKAIKEQVIIFTYSGEVLEYEFKKSDVEKIDFGSGRTEFFNAQSSSSEKKPTGPAGSTPEQRKNKIAVLPFEIQTNDPGLASELMAKQVQQSCIAALREQSPSQTIQDPMVTNNILSANRFSAANISQHTPHEWAEILGVQYVIIGSYSIQNKGTSSYGSDVSSYNKKKTDDKSKGTVVSSSNSYTTTSYNTRVFLNVYSDSGDQLFSDSRAPAFGSVDSYKSAVKNLVKKTAFGKK
jgi:TolB-like protein